MTALLLLALAAAPGCPAALARADALPPGQLPGEAGAILRALQEAEAGSGGPSAALGEEARAAGSAAGAAGPAAGHRFQAALARHCALAAAPRLAPPSPADRAEAAEILGRPEFRRARADPEALRRWLALQWQRLLGLLETGEAERYAAVSRTFILALAALGGLVALAVLARRRASASPARASPAPGEGPAPSTPDDRLAAAAEAAARGQAALAVRLALLAALSALERAGAVPPGRALTNAELLAHLEPGPPARREALRTLARLFDRTVYGGRPAERGEAEAALGAARALGAGGER